VKTVRNAVRLVTVNHSFQCDEVTGTSPGNQRSFT